MLSLVFAALAAPVILVESFVQPTFEVGAQAPVTMRVPLFSAGNGCMPRNADGQRGAVVVSRGQLIDEQTGQQASCLQAAQPATQPALVAFFVAMFFVALLYTSHLRRSQVGRLLRTQAVLLTAVLGVAIAVKLVLMLTAVSVLIVPVAGLAVIAAMSVDRSAGLATGLLSAVLVSCLVPFNAGVLSVLTVQVLAAIMLPRGRPRSAAGVVLASLLGGGAAAIAYSVFYYLAWHAVPLAELQTPLYSAWAAAGASGVLAIGVVFASESALRLALGGVTKSKLVALEDLSNPLLKQIASKSPGTWQHSLAMANMAEIAANEIRANGRLVRVGAYYHDLGKSLQPKYFIENLVSGESSPHDKLDPQTSCDAIFAHVTEGVRLGRRSGLPERIIDFMHMHHGDGLLEYFWAKYQEGPQDDGLTEDDFRYPGVIPDSKETAILAIVDAVEAASRTLRQPEEAAIRNLVQRIVYGKLHLGQLDDSGLTAADLRRISNSLIDTLKHAHHGRIEYPWQKKERAARESAALEDEPSSTSLTSQLAREPRLDSLDVPRPVGGGKPTGRKVSALESAVTEPVSIAELANPRKPQALIVEEVDETRQEDTDHSRPTADIAAADAIDAALEDPVIESLAPPMTSSRNRPERGTVQLFGSADDEPLRRAGSDDE